MSSRTQGAVSSYNFCDNQDRLPPTPPSSTSGQSQLLPTQSHVQDCHPFGAIRPLQPIQARSQRPPSRPPRDAQRPLLGSASGSAVDRGRDNGLQQQRHRTIFRPEQGISPAPTGRRPTSSTSPAIQACARLEDVSLRDSIATVIPPIGGWDGNQQTSRSNVRGAISGFDPLTGLKEDPALMPTVPLPAVSVECVCRLRCPVHGQISCPTHGSGGAGCPVHGLQSFCRTSADMCPMGVTMPPFSRRHQARTASVRRCTSEESLGCDSADLAVSVEDEHIHTIDAIVRSYQERLSHQLAAEEEERARELLLKRVDGYEDASGRYKMTPYPAVPNVPGQAHQNGISSRIYWSASSQTSRSFSRKTPSWRSNSLIARALRRPLHPPPLPPDYIAHTQHILQQEAARSVAIAHATPNQAVYSVPASRGELQPSDHRAASRGRDGCSSQAHVLASWCDWNSLESGQSHYLLRPQHLQNGETSPSAEWSPLSSSFAPRPPPPPPRASSFFASGSLHVLPSVTREHSNSHSPTEGAYEPWIDRRAEVARKRFDLTRNDQQLAGASLPRNYSRIRGPRVAFQLQRPSRLFIFERAKGIGKLSPKGASAQDRKENGNEDERVGWGRGSAETPVAFTGSKTKDHQQQYTSEHASISLAHSGCIEENVAPEAAAYHDYASAHTTRRCWSKKKGSLLRLVEEGRHRLRGTKEDDSRSVPSTRHRQRSKRSKGHYKALVMLRTFTFDVVLPQKRTLGIAFLGLCGAMTLIVVGATVL